MNSASPHTAEGAHISAVLQERVSGNLFSPWQNQTSTSTVIETAPESQSERHLRFEILTVPRHSVPRLWMWLLSSGPSKCFSIYSLIMRLSKTLICSGEWLIIVLQDAAVWFCYFAVYFLCQGHFVRQCPNSGCFVSNLVYFLCVWEPPKFSMSQGWFLRAK